MTWNRLSWDTSYSLRVSVERERVSMHRTCYAANLCTSGTCCAVFLACVRACSRDRRSGYRFPMFVVGIATVAAHTGAAAATARNTVPCVSNRARFSTVHWITKPRGDDSTRSSSAHSGGIVESSNEQHLMWSVFQVENALLSRGFVAARPTLATIRQQLERHRCLAWPAWSPSGATAPPADRTLLFHVAGASQRGPRETRVE